MEFYFGIPTYKRPDNQRTLTYLEKIGISKEQIIMSVQTEQDYKDYKKHESRVGALLYKEQHNLAGNRNTILEALPRMAKVILLDDDITVISKLRGKELEPITDAEELLKIIRYGYTVAARLGTIGFGVYPVHNAFFMSQNVADRWLIEGTFMAIQNNGLLFNTRFDTKEDYEYSCRAIRAYRNLVRLNYISCKAQRHSRGGCEEHWADKTSVIQVAKELCSRYPDIVKPNKSKPGEILMVTKKERTQ